MMPSVRMTGRLAMALLVPGTLLLSGCDLFGGGGSDTAGVSRTTTTQEPTTPTTKPADDGGRERAAADRDGDQRERNDQQEESSQGTTTPPTSAAPEPEPTTTTTTTTTPPPEDDGGGNNSQSGANVALQVEVTDGSRQLRSATLSCVGDEHVASGFLSGSGGAACNFARQQATRTRLTEGSQRDPEMMCTMIHGGPEVATVTGNIDGSNVDTTFDRVNGCRISEFDGFAPLIGPSSGMAVE